MRRDGVSDQLSASIVTNLDALITDTNLTASKLQVGHGMLYYMHVGYIQHKATFIYSRDYDYVSQENVPAVLVR